MMQERQGPIDAGMCAHRRKREFAGPMPGRMDKGIIVDCPFTVDWRLFRVRTSNERFSLIEVANDADEMADFAIECE